MKTKIIAYYLPQYHQIPENDRWWGEGFTEWVNVKKAKPLFETHYQPRIPLHNNYYDLTSVDVMKWQAGLAQKYGLYGFCFYHYWFHDKPLLEKPILNYLKCKDIDFPFCICWANESWTNAWAQADSRVILEQRYGGKKDWKAHFEFLLPFFKDKRYIKENGSLLLVVYRPYLCDCMIDMLNYWKQLAIENGFNGIKVASQRFEEPSKYKEVFDYMDYHIEYQPDYNRCHMRKPKTFWVSLKRGLHDFLLDKLNLDISLPKREKCPEIFDYDAMWNKILEAPPVSDRAIAGGFVDWDNTPRIGRRGSCFKNVTPEKFGFYIKKQLEHIHKDYHNDYMFLFAWNEWGEGGYMEPDEKHGYSYLEALRDALKQEDERV